MAIQNWSEEIVLVDLPSEPQIVDELKDVVQAIRDRNNCDVVIDFSEVDIITSSALSQLLRLRKLLADCGHRLLFCNVAPATRSVFTITGIDEIFKFVEDKFIALAGLQMAN